MAFNKSPRWESKRYRDAAKGQDCKIRLPGCRNDTETVCLAHANGAGVALKASDHNAVDACDHCHCLIDGRVPLRGFEREYVAKEFERARLETIINRIERGILK